MEQNRNKRDDFRRKPNDRKPFDRKPAEERQEPRTKGEDIIAGRNAVMEALRSGRTIDTLLIAKGEHTGSLTAIQVKAKEKGIIIKEADSRKLDALSGGAVHQGVVAIAAVREYSTVEDMFALAQERGEDPFLIIADEVEDPHNLGAILRTAAAAGAHGVIVPKRRAAGLTYAVGKASAGAVEYVPVARVANLAATIEELKERGVWIYAADMDGTPWCEADFSGPCGLVIGGEGHGVGRLVKEKCDVVLSLPMNGKVNSLNASVACGIMMYEVARQRGGISARNPVKK